MESNFGETFSNLKRSEWLMECHEKEVDLIIIGGGITGAGIALDAQMRGISTALVEMQDFAAGTSSRSTKLVHGGLRYLKQFEVAMVAEVGKERAIVYENGPHVTTPEWMILPLYKGGTFGKLTTAIGLKMYDFLAGVKKQERRVMLNVQQTLEREPLLRKEGLKGAGCYVEYRTDDARLTIEVLKRAVQAGTKALNYVKAEKMLYNDDRLCGVQVSDRLTGKTYSLFAKNIVNAAGPWVDELREMDQSKNEKALHLTKGVHLVFDQNRFPLRHAVYFDTKDGRMIFAIPRAGKTYLGTTDTTYQGDIAHPRMTVADRDYLLAAVNDMFPALCLNTADIESSWSGLRPLIHEEGKSASEISRKDEIFISPSGLISIAGGKLTGYRKMAESIVDLVVKKLAQHGIQITVKSQTKHLPISGGDVGGAKHFPKFLQEKIAAGLKLGITEKEAESLVRLYGSNIDHVYALVPMYADREGDQQKLPLALFLSLEYSLQYEMTMKPTDFFIRRTGALFFDIAWVRRWQSEVIEHMSQRLNWSEDEKAIYTHELERALHDAVTPIEDGV